MTNSDALYRATQIVAREFEGPHCVDAAALLVEVGKHLGYELEAVPVSLGARAENGQSYATGTMGRAFIESYLSRRGRVQPVGEFTGGSPFEREAGHMIVVSEADGLLLDPTFAQFHRLGKAAVGLYADEVSARGGGRFWQLADEDFFVRYFRADDFKPEVNFDALRAKHAARAEAIARSVMTSSAT